MQQIKMLGLTAEEARTLVELSSVPTHAYGLQNVLNRIRASASQGCKTCVMSRDTVRFTDAIELSKVGFVFIDDKPETGQLMISWE